jgi:predicted dehydrogenase
VVFVNLQFKSGVMAQIQLSWLDPRKERRVTVVGSRKMLEFDDVHPVEKLRIYDKGVERPPRSASSPSSSPSATATSTSPRSRWPSRSSSSAATSSSA